MKLVTGKGSEEQTDRMNKAFQNSQNSLNQAQEQCE
jgi:hypothetical protein